MHAKLKVKMVSSEALASADGATPMLLNSD